MVENEMASIKDRLNKYVKFIIIACVVGFILSFVCIMYANTTEILKSFGVTKNSELSKMPDTIKSVLKAIFYYREYGIGETMNLDDAQKAAAQSYANGNYDAFIGFMKVITIAFAASLVIGLAGGILMAVAFKVEKINLVKIAEYLVLASITLAAAGLLVYAIILFSKGYLFDQSKVVYLIAGGFGVLIALLSVALYFLRPLFNIKLAKLFAKILKFAAVGTIVLAVVTLFINLKFAFDNAGAKTAHSFDILFVAVAFTSSFAALGFNSLSVDLYRLKENKEDNELFALLKQAATENVAEKEAKLRKQAAKAN